MNAYWIGSVELKDWDYHTSETYSYWELVFAETRGKAKTIFAAKHDLNYIEDIATCRLVEKNIDKSEGIAHPEPEILHNDPLWWKVYHLSESKDWEDDYWQWIREEHPDVLEPCNAVTC